MGSAGQMVFGLAVGALLGFLFIAMYAACGWRPHHRLSTHAAGVATSALPRALTVVSTIALAPLVEEPLFRGVLYGGYCRSFGPAWAMTLTTLLFSLGHIYPIIRSPLSVVGVVGMALAALWARLRSSAIGPAIALHAGYNAVVVLLVLL